MSSRGAGPAAPGALTPVPLLAERWKEKIPSCRAFCPVNAGFAKLSVQYELPLLVLWVR